MRVILVLSALTFAFQMNAQVDANIDIIEMTNMESWTEPDPSAFDFILSPVIEIGEREVYRYAKESDGLMLKIHRFEGKWNGHTWSAMNENMDAVTTWYRHFQETTETMPGVLGDYPVRIYKGDFTTASGEKINAERRVAVTYDETLQVFWLVVSYTALR